jgi:hypothetical protein
LQNLYYLFDHYNEFNIFFGTVFTDSKSQEVFLSWKQATIAPAELNLVFGREKKHMFKQSTKVGRLT